LSAPRAWRRTAVARLARTLGRTVRPSVPDLLPAAQSTRAFMPSLTKMNKTTIQVVRLSAGTIYKSLFIGTIFSFLPLTTILGILALFGLNTVTWNGAQVHGFGGLITGVLLGAFFCFFFTAVVGTACAFGLWLYSKFERVHISYFTQQAHSATEAESQK
jgi:hypothetical protein